MTNGQNLVVLWTVAKIGKDLNVQLINSFWILKYSPLIWQIIILLYEVLLHWITFEWCLL